MAAVRVPGEGDLRAERLRERKGVRRVKQREVRAPAINESCLALRSERQVGRFEPRNAQRAPAAVNLRNVVLQQSRAGAAELCLDRSRISPEVVVAADREDAVRGVETLQRLCNPRDK